MIIVAKRVRACPSVSERTLKPGIIREGNDAISIVTDERPRPLISLLSLEAAQFLFPLLYFFTYKLH